MKTLTTLMLASLLMSLPLMGQESGVFQNRLLPFKADGCSKFPDGLAGMDWTDCCIEHDLAYWVGGTKEEKIQADKNLKTCVGEASFSFIGSIMEFGVRFGGAAPLPMTWRWGYGWSVNRGYEALGASEKIQIEALYPEKILIQVETVPALSTRHSITGDNCLDVALTEIQKIEGDVPLSYDVQSHQVRTDAEGYIHNYQIHAHECYQIEILTLKQNSCSNEMTELRARGQIRLRSIINGCE